MHERLNKKMEGEKKKKRRRRRRKTKLLNNSKKASSWAQADMKCEHQREVSASVSPTHTLNSSMTSLKTRLGLTPVMLSGGRWV